jgi:hypothetical protein
MSRSSSSSSLVRRELQVQARLTLDLVSVVVAYLLPPALDLSCLNAPLSIAVVGKAASGKTHTLAYLMKHSKTHAFVGFEVSASHDDCSMLPKPFRFNNSNPTVPTILTRAHPTSSRWGLFWPSPRQVDPSVVKQRTQKNLQIYTQAAPHDTLAHPVDYLFFNCLYTPPTQTQETTFADHDIALYLDLLLPMPFTYLVIDFTLSPPALFFLSVPFSRLKTTLLGDETYQRFYDFDPQT